MHLVVISLLLSIFSPLYRLATAIPDTMAELLLVLLGLCAICASGQQLEFSAVREISFLNNLLRFRCEDGNGPVSNPMFFRDGTLLDNVFPSIGLYTISRALEGDFSCGSGSRPSSNVQTLVGALSQHHK